MNKYIYFDTKELNKIQIKEFGNVRIGNMLHYVKELPISDFHVLKCIYHIIAKTLFFSNEFLIKGNADTLFLFSNSYAGRRDLLANFDKVVSLSKNYLKMNGIKTKKLHLGYIINLMLLRQWDRQIAKEVPMLNERLYILSQLYGIYTDYIEYQSYVKKNNLKINKLLSFCDVHPIDYYFTHCFNEQGKTTVTVQHGVYCSDTNAWAYTESRSTYFLANSQYSIKEAVTAGKKEKGLCAAGLLSYINEKVIPRELNNRRIGVILDGELLHEDNVQMLKFMQAFCKKEKLELYIKLHPTSGIENYSDIFDFEYITEICGKEKNIFEFASSIDVAIIRNSTCLLELINQGIPCFIFSGQNQEVDVYKHMHEIRFSTEETIHCFLEEIMNCDYQEKFDKLKRYLGDGENATNNYKKLLHQIGIT